jgi:DNA invertase Pin-like site-specific DNA recombinase
MSMARRTVRKAADPSIAIAYVRVSKDDQKLSPAAQARAIERYAAENGITLLATCLDLGVCSADKVSERPGLSLALDLVREHRAGALIVAKRDRLARKMLVTLSVEEELEETGASLVSAAGGNGKGDFVRRRLDDVIAEDEHAKIRERTALALAEKRDNREKTGGGVPYGYRVENGPLRVRRGIPTPLKMLVLSKPSSVARASFTR